MEQLERQARAQSDLSAASEGPKGSIPSQVTEIANPDAIDLDDMDE